MKYSILLFLFTALTIPLRAQLAVEVTNVKKNVIRYSEDTIEKFRNTEGVLFDEHFWFNRWNSFNDWNNDGKDDLVMEIVSLQDSLGRGNGKAFFGLFYQKDNYIFEEIHDYLMFVDGGSSNFSRSVADFNMDGLLDVYIPSYWGSYSAERNGASIFINNGESFNHSYLDTSMTRLTAEQIRNGQRPNELHIASAFAQDLENSGRNDLYIGQENYDYPGGKVFRRYRVFSDDSATVDYLPKVPDSVNFDITGELWGTSYGQSRTIEDSLYTVFSRDAYHNGKEYSDHKICVWSLPLTKDSQSKYCIDVKRNENLLKQNALSEAFAFWPTDLDNDGKIDFIFQMYTLDAEFHTSIHVFNSKGIETTDKWFNNDSYIETTQSNGNGIYVVDLNGDGYDDIVPVNGYNENEKFFIFINNGEKFDKVKINTPARFGDLRLGNNGFKVPLDLNKDGYFEIINIKNGRFSDANIDILFIDYQLYDQSFLLKASPVAFSVESGRYLDSVQVSMTSPSSDARIYYTTDGSVPFVKGDESQLYDSPIWVKSDSYIRAVAGGSNFIDSDIRGTRYYIENESNYTLIELGNLDSFVLEGDPDSVLIFHWSPFVDSYAESSLYRLEMSFTANFEEILYQTELSPFTQYRITYREFSDIIDAAIRSSGIPTGSLNKLYLKVLGTDGKGRFIEHTPPYMWEFKRGRLTNIDLNDTYLPSELELTQNYPNPFNPVTSIIYGLPTSGKVTLEVFNLQGQKVATLVNAFRVAGRHQILFDGSNLSSGIYLYRLQFGTSQIIQKMSLIK